MSDSVRSTRSRANVVNEAQSSEIPAAMDAASQRKRDVPDVSSDEGIGWETRKRSKTECSDSDSDIVPKEPIQVSRSSSSNSLAEKQFETIGQPQTVSSACSIFGYTEEMKLDPCR